VIASLLPKTITIMTTTTTTRVNPFVGKKQKIEMMSTTTIANPLCRKKN
jgi:hypothetical protein